MSTVSKLEVELTLDDKNFQMKIRGTNAALSAFKKSLGGADTRVKRHEKSVRNLGTAFRHTIVTFGLMRQAIQQAWRMSGSLVQGIVDVNAEFERLNVLLTGMSKGVTAVEKAADAAKQFEQVIELAKNAPFAVKELTSSWVKFRSVGIDPSTGALNALVDAVAAFGGTGDILHRASIAVQQMAGKGVISMEELRQQMGEAVPQAMVLLARGMNMSVNDMVNAISRGAVIAEPALAKLFAEFELTFGGAAIKLMETYIGSLARLITVWQLTLKEIGEASGLFEVTKQIVKDLIVELDNPAVRRFGIDVAKGMRQAVEAIVNAIRWIQRNVTTIKNVVKAYVAWKVALVLLNLNVHSIALKGLNFQIGLLATRAGLARLALLNWRNSGAASILMIKNLGKAIKVMLLTNPVGWILLIVGALATLWHSTRDVKDATHEAIDALLLYKDAAGEETFKAAAVQLENMNLALIKQKSIIDFMFDNPPSYFSDEEIDKQIEATTKSYFELLAFFKKGTDELAASIEKAAARQFKAIARAAKNEINATLEEARNRVREQDVALDTLFKKHEIDEEERLRRRMVNWKAFGELQNSVFESARDKAIEELVALRQSGDASDKELKRSEARLSAIVNLFFDAGNQLENLMATISKDTDFLSDEAKNAKKLEAAFNTFITGTKSKLAGLQEQLRDGMPSLAKFLSDLDSGKFGKLAVIDVTKLTLLKERLVEIDEAIEELARKRTLESAMKNIGTVLAKAREEARIFQEALDASLTEVPNNRVRRFRRNMEALRATLVAANIDLTEFNKVAEETLLETKNVSALEEIMKINKEINELNEAHLLTAKERFEEELRLLDVKHRGLLLILAESENIDLLKEQYAKLIEAKRKAFLDNTPMRRMLREWQDVMGNMEKAQTRWMSSFVDAIVDGVAEGKFAFADFAKAVLKDLLKILLRALIVRAVLAVIGGGGGVEEVLAPDFVGPPALLAKGGIFGSDGLSPLNRYARGGIATKPQIAIFGEGDKNEAFVPLPDGRSIPVSLGGNGGGSPPDVTVNVINESGVPLEAEQQGGLEFDGEGFVLDVVLKAVTRPGSFRDGMKSATS